ncbi:low specificity L-threonine aldolase [Calidifontibacter sp. DB0510]|uniref:Low specificity L-threonine aldolase n=1 Tax=Metallococcus carri TaxID=1656884 RepID=A0A967AZJ0_9MICO|nr:low specificity L-threonine aldolase [Metallococcus carri]NHN55568.1 low specificity L-threonine aldolase [Metallococcus carri]NOP38248.1 low specificity L-threonine aldolase [Calidifontibacter sp. DB2511S]
MTGLEQLHDPNLRSFASDNYAGIHPDVLAALAVANGGHQVAYGEDVYTERLQDVMRAQFGTDVEVFPVFNGTGANVVALQACTERWEAVVCAATAHINVDECAAPERMAGLKLLTVPTPEGKLTPELVASVAIRKNDEHAAQAKVVSITQTTELGTAYSVDEIRAITSAAHDADMLVHVDGSRIANAVATLGVSLKEMLTDTGVDIMSFGGTKNGAMLAEAVVVLRPQAVHGMKFLRKSSMQLASKMRFVSVQLEALLTDDLFKRNALHANEMAARLAAAVRDIPGLTVPRPVQANAVFAILPREVSRRLMEDFRFYFWDEATGEVRWMCAWDTMPEDVDAFAAAIKAALS